MKVFLVVMFFVFDTIIRICKGYRMHFKHFVAKIAACFVPGKYRRAMVRVKIQYDTKSYVKFVRDYIGDSDAKITTCVGYGCNNFIVLVNSQFAFKFPLKDDGAERALRELRITTALRKYTKFKIPEMEIIKWNNMAVRKYEFFPGVALMDVPSYVVMENRQYIVQQIAQFIHEVGLADPVEIRDLKPKKTMKPGYLYGWFHNDIWHNFILNPDTFDIVGFIDWETVIFGSFKPCLARCDRIWDKLGYRGMVIDILAEYSKLYYEK